MRKGLHLQLARNTIKKQLHLTYFCFLDEDGIRSRIFAGDVAAGLELANKWTLLR